MLFQTIHSHSFPEESDIAPIPQGWFPHNWESLVYGLQRRFSLKTEIFYSITRLVFFLPSLSHSQMLHFSLGLCGFLSRCFQMALVSWSKRPTRGSNPISTWQCRSPNIGAKSYQLTFNLVLPTTAYWGLKYPHYTSAHGMNGGLLFSTTDYELQGFWERWCRWFGLQGLQGEKALVLVKQGCSLICSTYPIYALHRKPLETH